MEKLINLLYASAHDEALWPEALDELRHVLKRTDTRMLMETPPTGPERGRCADLQLLATGGDDPRHDALQARVTMPGGWTLALSSAGALAQPLDELAEHLRRAVELHSTLNRPPDLRETMDVWAESDVCVLIARGDRIEYANARALQALDSRRVITLHGTSLRFVDEELDRAFRSFERSVECGHPKKRLNMLSGNHDADRALVEFAPTRVLSPRGDIAHQGQDEGLLITITFVNESGAGRARAIEALACLTPTERDILASLAGGASVEAIARQTDRSVQTVRWHIKNIISKTGSSSLTDAIRTASLLVPL